MKKILCAIRGGEASYRTQDEAIKFAKESNSELYFFYAADSSFLDKTAVALRKNLVDDELDHMGEFLLTLALVRAKEQGVQASMVIKHGLFQEELVNAVEELDIDTVIIGKPAGEGSIYSLDQIQVVADKISDRIKVEVLVK